MEATQRAGLQQVFDAILSEMLTHLYQVSLA
jgi:hypothetical protein